MEVSSREFLEDLFTFNMNMDSSANLQMNTFTGFHSGDNLNSEKIQEQEVNEKVINSYQKLQHDTKIAKEDLKQIQSLNPKNKQLEPQAKEILNEETLYSQCITLQIEGKYLESHSQFTNFLYKYPKSEKIPEVFRHLAQIEYNLSLFIESANTLKKLLVTGVCNFPLHEILTDISRCYRMAGRIQEELEYLEKALENYAESSVTAKILYRIKNCYQKLCYLHPEAPHLADFLSTYQLAVQDENGFLILKQEYLEHLGALYELHFKYNCAFTCYKLYLNTDSSNWIIWCKMGNLCMKLNRNHDGVKAFLQAVKYNPSSVQSLLALAEAYESIGELNEAMAVFQHAHALNPSRSTEKSIDNLNEKLQERPSKKVKSEVENPYENEYILENMIHPKPAHLNHGNSSTLMVHFPSSEDIESPVESEHVLTNEGFDSPELKQTNESSSPLINPQVNHPDTQIYHPSSFNSKNIKTLSPSIANLDKKDENLIDLIKGICHKEPITVIKKAPETYGLDLSKFSSSILSSQVPDFAVEGRTQYYQDADENLENGVPTWNCTSKMRLMKLQNYVKYQSQFIDPKTSEDRREKLKKGKSLIDFGTNIDMSDEKKWEPQLDEIKKLPDFLGLHSKEDMMWYYNFPILGVNRAQLYMKVPGCRTPCHQENNNFCSVNINIGPDPCEWFAVDHKYWTQVEALCQRKRVEFLKGSWWPNIVDLEELGIPVIRFQQQAGEIVFVNSGTLHWVQSLGVCNNVAWNVGPQTATQYHLALERYFFNLKDDYKSIIPMETLSWKLTQMENPCPELYRSIRSFLIDSLNNQKEMENRLKRKNIRVVNFPAENSPAFYCCKCYKELFNYIFIRDGPTDREKSTYCETCWFTKIKSRKVLACRRKTIEELSNIFEKFQKIPM